MPTPLNIVPQSTRSGEGASFAASIRAACEAASALIDNAVRHGFYERLQGEVTVSLTTSVASETILDVCDDGWGFDLDKAAPGRGFRLLRAMGTLIQSKTREPAGSSATCVRLVLPAPFRSACFPPSSPNIYAWRVE